MMYYVSQRIMFLVYVLHQYHAFALFHRCRVSGMYLITFDLAFIVIGWIYESDLV